MLPVPSAKTSPATRTTRDRIVDGAFHATIALLAAAIVLVFAIGLHGPR
jgi:hypothetical protein